MHAITVKAPWAQAIARFGKVVENRSRRPPAHLLGQRIAIHVSQSGTAMDKVFDDWNEGLRPAHLRPLVNWMFDWTGEHGDDVPDAGRIIATARLVGWCKGEPEHADWMTATGSATYHSHLLPAWRSPWFTGPVGWVLADVVALREPVGRTVCAFEGCRSTCYSEAPECALCDGRRAVLRTPPIRGQVYPFPLSPEVEAAVLAAEVQP